MPYIKTDWKTGDVITAPRMNKIEDALASIDTVVDQIDADIDQISDDLDSKITVSGTTMIVS